MGASLRDRATRASPRAMLRCLGYSATIACAGCGPHGAPHEPTQQDAWNSQIALDQTFANRILEQGQTNAKVADALGKQQDRIGALEGRRAQKGGGAK